MATTKQRINITADPEIEQALKSAAKRDNVPVATKAAELIQIGLALEEDLALSVIAELRSKKKGLYVPHDKAWL